LYSSTAPGNGTTSEWKEHIWKLLNFFPVLSEDENGEMIELNAEQVLSVPRKIRSQEVMKRGFMSNFLFQNISNIFGAPKEVMDIINQFPVANEPKKNEEPLPDNPGEGLDLDEYGEIAPKESLIIGTAADIFGEKKYGTSVNEIVSSTLGNPGEQDAEETHQQLDQIKKAIHEQVVQPLIETAQQHFGDDMHKSDRKSLNSTITNKVDAEVERKFTDFNVQQSNREAERKEELNKSDTAENRIPTPYLISACASIIRCGLQNRFTAAVLR